MAAEVITAALIKMAVAVILGDRVPQYPSASSDPGTVPELYLYLLV